MLRAFSPMPTANFFGPSGPFSVDGNPFCTSTFAGAPTPSDFQPTRVKPSLSTLFCDSGESAFFCWSRAAATQSGPHSSVGGPASGLSTGVGASAP